MLSVGLCAGWLPGTVGGKSTSLSSDDVEITLKSAASLSSSLSTGVFTCSDRKLFKADDFNGEASFIVAVDVIEF